MQAVVKAGMLLLLLVAAMMPARASASPVDASVAQIRNAVKPRHDGSNVVLLMSLRQLRDDSLRPLFRELVQHESWQVQVQVVLGLAELDADGVDPELFSQTMSTAQEAIVANGLDLGLIRSDRIKQMLLLDGLGPLPRLMLIAEQPTSDVQDSNDELRMLAGHDNIEVSGLASLLLARAGEIEPFNSVLTRVQRHDASRKSRYMSWLLDATGQYEVTSMNDWVRSLARDTQGVESSLIVLTALHLDASRNIDLWQSYLQERSSYSHRIRAGLLLLTVAQQVAPGGFDELTEGYVQDPLLNRMAAAGKAVASGENVIEALTALLESNNKRATDWVLNTLGDLEPAHAAAVCEAYIDGTSAERHIRARRATHTVSVMAMLHEIDPQRAMSKLRQHADDSDMANLLLLGLYESHDAAAAAGALLVPREGFTRLQSLATLLTARHAQALEPEVMDRLGTIASGGGLVSDVLRTQAAWLYLKHSGQIESALPRILN